MALQKPNPGILFSKRALVDLPHGATYKPRHARANLPAHFLLRQKDPSQLLFTNRTKKGRTPRY